MNLKTYRAASIADALGQIKKDLGSDAVILHTRTFKQGGLLGFRARKMVEITASSSVNVVHPLARKGKAPVDGPTRPGADMLRRTYAGVGAKAETTQSLGAATSLRTATLAAVAAASDDVCIASGGGGGAHRGQGAESAGAAAAATALATPRTTAAAADPERLALGQGLWDELACVKRMVGHVLQASRGQTAAPCMPEALFQRYLRLIESEVASELADEIVGAVRDELSAAELADESIVHQAVLKRLAAHIPVAIDAPKPGRMPDGRPLTIALVGPTGVGKTTTIAKLAANYKLRQGRSVGLITSDTYRIAAVDQLRTYANIIGLPLRVALTPAEMSLACEAMSGVDVVLIDTAGRSQHDGDRLAELSEFLGAARPHETHLVLSGASNQAVMLRAAERFAGARPNRVIFTKLDETVNFGVLVSAARSIGAALSYVTTGQEVPDQIEQGRADRLARLVLEGGVLR